MAQATAVSRGEYLEECRAVNRRVSDAVRRATSINPRTKVVGYSRDTFSVDVSTGSILVAEVEPDALEGYLAHENGHRSLFPASTAGSIAFVSAVGTEAPWASRDDVVSAANVVADVFSDSMLLRVGLGRTLSKRVPDFVSRVKSLDALMCFKVLLYKAIEYASKENATLIGRKHLDRAVRDLESVFQSDQAMINRVYGIASEFVDRMNRVLTIETPANIAKVFLNPFKAPGAPHLSFLVRAAVELLHLNREMSSSRSAGGGRKQGGSQAQPTDTAQSSSSQGSGAGAMDSGETGVEGIDIEPGEVDATDVHKAIRIMRYAFGVDVGEGGVAIEMVFSEKVRKAVEKFIERIKLLYIQNDKKTSKPSGFRKEVTELWLHPMGEPDEDSVLKERHKLLWKVEYRVPHPRGRIEVVPSSVPERVVVVMDESGSTLESFENSNVLSVEALISMLVVAGIKYRGGAKEISVVKFSQDVSKVYSGRDVVEACAKILVPHRRAGGGTNIVEAVDVGISETTKNSALVVVTDLEIPVDVADEIGRKLRASAESGRVGFVVFVVVNQKKDDSVLDVIGKYLSSQNSVVAYVSSADDLENLGNTLISKVLRMR
ncbi:MAG: VWA domain-containing protein [Thermofilaceae archaeon]